MHFEPGPLNAVQTAVRQWLESVVLGLELCPFAARPFHAGQVRIFVSEARSELDLLTELQMELQRLEDTQPAILETTLIAIPRMLGDFADYNDFLDRADELLERFEWAGDYQVASFHPHYQFADTQPEDAENLTNRAPYPLLHLLRERSIDAALDSHPDPEQIPRDNIRRMRQLGAAQRRQLFGYLGGSDRERG